MATTVEGERFSGQLVLYRGRTRLTQQQLATRAGVHVRSIQCWEGSVSYPSADSLKALISVFLYEGALRAGCEAADAENFWSAALREAPRMCVPFDSVWFDQLLEAYRSPQRYSLVANVRAVEAQADETPHANRHDEDWADAPDASECVGRACELATLREWVVAEQCRIVQIVGMGGIGKTMLAARLAKELALEFDLVYWRSARYGPTSGEWLTQAIRFLRGADTPIPDQEDERIRLLIELLRERRCLLVLDNLESLLEPFDSEGRFRETFVGYGAILEAIAERSHQSCLLVTSREGLPDPALLTGGPVRSLELGGLTVDASRVVVRDRELCGTELDWADFVKRCGGNALLLKMTSETVRSVFSGRIDEFLLGVGSNGAIHGGVRRLLISQLDQRLSPEEQEVLRLLAVSGEPLTPERILADLGPQVEWASVIEALHGLRRRSLLERDDSGTGFRLHSVARDYVVGQLAQRDTGWTTSPQPVLARLPHAS